MIRTAPVLVILALASPALADPFWRNAPSTEGGNAAVLSEPAAPQPAPGAHCDPDVWLGYWDTEYGPLTFTSAADGKVEGTYTYLNGHIAGTLDATGCVLEGRWDQDPSHRDPSDVGVFRFVFDLNTTSWTGTWAFDANPSYIGDWTGTRASGIKT